MNAPIPAERVAAVMQQEGRYVFTRDWYRYLSQSGIEQIVTLQATIASMQTTIAAQATQIAALNAGMSVVRDVAQYNTLTNADEIPDLGRR